jgi:hypothetical protein
MIGSWTPEDDSSGGNEIWMRVGHDGEQAGGAPASIGRPTTARAVVTAIHRAAELAERWLARIMSVFTTWLGEITHDRRRVRCSNAS